MTCITLTLLLSELTSLQGLITTQDFIRMIGFVHTRRKCLALKEPSRRHIPNQQCNVPGTLLKAKESESRNDVDAIEGSSPQL